MLAFIVPEGIPGGGNGVSELKDYLYYLRLRRAPAGKKPLWVHHPLVVRRGSGALTALALAAQPFRNPGAVLHALFVGRRCAI